jgi:S1-C subfamily serine protease
VQEVSLAGNRHADLLFDESSISALGLNFWIRYVVTIDFPGRAMYLKKSNRFNQPDVEDASGLTILRKSGKTIVRMVREGSPASAVDVRPGDVIQSIDGVNVDKLSLNALRMRLCEEGKTVRLVASRDSKEREFALSLRDWWHATPSAN